VDTQSGLLAEVIILLRKQLSNPHRQYKRIGVIGVLVLLESIVARKELFDCTGNRYNIVNFFTSKVDLRQLTRWAR
jgi:hypothetical protein